MATRSIWNREIHLWFLPKTRFKWREPKVFLRLKDDEERGRIRWWVRPAAALFFTLMILAQWYLARFDPQKHPPTLHAALLMGFFAGVFFAYILPWLITYCPSEIRLDEKRITRVRGNVNQRLKYADIEYFAWRLTEGMNTLVIKGRKTKREMLLGVPSEISKDDVHLFLLGRDVMLQPGAR